MNRNAVSLINCQWIETAVRVYFLVANNTQKVHKQIPLIHFIFKAQYYQMSRSPEVLALTKAPYAYTPNNVG